MFIKLSTIDYYGHNSKVDSEIRVWEANAGFGLFKLSEVFTVEAIKVDEPEGEYLWGVKFKDGTYVNTFDDVPRLMSQAGLLIANE